MVVLEVRKPKPGLARGRLGAFVLVVAIVVVFAIDAAVDIVVGWFEAASPFAFSLSESSMFVNMESTAICDAISSADISSASGEGTFSDLFADAIAAGSC